MNSSEQSTLDSLKKLYIWFWKPNRKSDEQCAQSAEPPCMPMSEAKRTLEKAQSLQRLNRKIHCPKCGNHVFEPEQFVWDRFDLSFIRFTVIRNPYYEKRVDLVKATCKVCGYTGRYAPMEGEVVKTLPENIPEERMKELEAEHER